MSDNLPKSVEVEGALCPFCGCGRQCNRKRARQGGIASRDVLRFARRDRYVVLAGCAHVHARGMFGHVSRRRNVLAPVLASYLYCYRTFQPFIST